MAAGGQELEVLRHAASLPPEQRGAGGAAAGEPPPPALMRKLLEAAGGLEGRRAAVRRDLLRPSHTLPTRSLEQQVPRFVLADVCRKHSVKPFHKNPFDAHSAGGSSGGGGMGDELSLRRLPAPDSTSIHIVGL